MNGLQDLEPLEAQVRRDRLPRGAIVFDDQCARADDVHRPYIGPLGGDAAPRRRRRSSPRNEEGRANWRGPVRHRLAARRA